MAYRKKTTSELSRNVAMNKLDLLITIVNRKKNDYYTDLIQTYDVNFIFKVLGEGTASKQIQALLGLTVSEKVVIFSVIKRDQATKLLATLETKFHTIRDGKGIAFTIPFSSVIGRSIFGFLSNNKNTIKEESNA